MEKAQLDPWRVIRSFLSEVGSRDVPDIIDRAGLSVNWGLTDRDDYSHSMRWAAYRPRIDAAYGMLESDDERLRVAFSVARQLAQQGHGEAIDAALREIGWELREGSLAPTGATVHELFFPGGSDHDAYVEIRKIIQAASRAVDVIDPYVDSSTLTLLATCAKPGMVVRLLTTKVPSDFLVEAAAWRRQHPGVQLDIRTTREFHDRFIVVDGSGCWHIGCSIKDAGRRAFMLSRIEDQANRDALLQQLQGAWSSGTNV